MKRFYDLKIFDTPAINRSDVEALIEERLSGTIIENAIEQSAVLSRGRQLSDMAAGQERIPVLSQMPEAYFVEGDNGLKQTTKQAWENVTLYGEEIAAVIPIPERLIEDSSFDIIGEVERHAPEAFAKTFDAAVLFGTNKPTLWPDGVVKQCEDAGAAVTASGNLYTDLLGTGGVISKVEESGFFVNGHVADLKLRAALRDLKDNSGRPLFISDMQGVPNYSLDGSPITFVRTGGFDASKASLITGDWDKLVYAYRRGLKAKIFTEGVVQDSEGKIIYNLMQNDMIAIRLTMRIGWALPNPATMAKGKTGFPFAVLKPASK